MDDLISRQAAIDALCNDFCDGHQDCKYYPKCGNLKSIQELPTAQQDIIRCKECKYCDRGIDEDGNPFLKCLGWVYGGTQEEDFCSHAERRTDE